MVTMIFCLHETTFSHYDFVAFEYLFKNIETKKYGLGVLEQTFKCDKVVMAGGRAAKTNIIVIMKR